MTNYARAQRDYYARTADHYEEMHVREDDEHGIALAAFAGIATLKGATSVLDVGAGTGRALTVLRRKMGNIRLVGLEPVEELRNVGYAAGIPSDQLIEGDAMSLPFQDREFDFVIETGVLHHVPIPAKAVSEMARVARIGVMISDSNKFGQGSLAARWSKSLLRSAGLWNAMIWLQTGGKMSKFSEGDGVYYSYSVFDNYLQLKQNFDRVFLMNTSPLQGQATDLRSGATHAMILAFK